MKLTSRSIIDLKFFFLSYYKIIFTNLNHYNKYNSFNKLNHEQTILQNEGTKAKTLDHGQVDHDKMNFSLDHTLFHQIKFYLDLELIIMRQNHIDGGVQL